jgi:hypothetical protein
MAGANFSEQIDFKHFKVGNTQSARVFDQAKNESTNKKKKTTAQQK